MSKVWSLLAQVVPIITTVPDTRDFNTSQPSPSSQFYRPTWFSSPSWTLSSSKPHNSHNFISANRDLVPCHCSWVVECKDSFSQFSSFYAELDGFGSEIIGLHRKGTKTFWNKSILKFQILELPERAEWSCFESTKRNNNWQEKAQDRLKWPYMGAWKSYILRAWTSLKS